MRIQRRIFSGTLRFLFLCGWLLAWGARAQVSTNIVTMDHPAILYSPFNWGITNQAAKTINAGAYFKVLFGGTSCQLSTDTKASLAPYSQFWARVDGGPFVQYTLAAGNPVFAVAKGLVKRKHLLEVVIKSTSETIERWNKQSTAVVFTGLLLDNGATVSAPVRKPFNILIYGDSITEGVRVNGYANIANDTDRNDALQVYSWLLSQELPAEVGVVGFGATGINSTGSGSVPVLGKSYALLWAGQPRSFSDPEPDLILYNEGTNDGGSITTGFATVVRALLNAAPHARQVLLLPFNGTHAAELKSVVTNIGSSKVSFGDTKGFFNVTDSSDSLHPYGYTHLASIAPKMATLITPLLLLAPKGLHATATNSEIVLSWSALVGATNYNILCATNNGGPYTWIGSTVTTNFTDTAATNTTAYYYVITASLRTGETVYSSEVSVTPEAPAVLGASLNAGEGMFSLSWPSRAGNATLWETTNLTPPVQWLPVTNAWQDSNGMLNATQPVTKEGQQYFRLNP